VAGSGVATAPAGLVVKAAVRVMVSGFPRVGGNSMSGVAAGVVRDGGGSGGCKTRSI